MTTARLRLRGLRKAFGSTLALDDLDLDVQAGEVHALLGANGSGKSTLVKILAGVVAADSGTITLAGQQLPAVDVSPQAAKELGLRFVHQDPAVFPGMSVMENLALGHGYPSRFTKVSWPVLRERAAALIDRFDLTCEPETPMATLGPAQRTMVAIARGLQDELDGAQREHTLVLDEPTASLSAGESNQLLEYIRVLANKGASILYITHRLQELDQAADAVTVMRDGSRVFAGPYEQGSRESLIEYIAGRPLVGLYPEPPGPTEAKPVLTVASLNAPGLEDVTFQANRGEILGIAGFLGAGRSHLLECLFGAEERTGTVAVDGTVVPSGSITAAMNAGVAFVPEDRLESAAFTGLSIRENLSAGMVRHYWNKVRLDHRRENHDSHRLLHEYLIKAHNHQQHLGALSGGNQQKVVMARWLRRSPKVLLLDEPTQGVDAGARPEIYRMVRAQTNAGATAVIVSSDFEELANLCDRVLVLNNGRITDDIPGDGLTAQQLTRLCFTPTGSRTV